MKKIIVCINDSGIKELVPGYLKRMQEYTRTLESALAVLDFASIETVGHNVKGTAEPYGFEQLGYIAERLEAAAKKRDAVQVAVCVREFTDYVDRVDVVYE